MTNYAQFKDAVVNSFLEGFSKLYQTVRPLLGSQNNLVLVRKKEAPPIATPFSEVVLKSFFLLDKFENLGAQLAKEAALRTQESIGLGAISTLTFIQKLSQAVFLMLKKGKKPLLLKKEIEDGVLLLNEFWEKSKTTASFQELERVAITATKNPTLAKLIVQGLETVGVHGSIQLEKNSNIDYCLSIQEGCELQGGYLSPYFITNPQNMTIEWENPKTLITNQKFKNANDIIPLLEKLVEFGREPLLLFCPMIEGEAKTTLVINNIKGTIPICAIALDDSQIPLNQLLEDLTLLFGGNLVESRDGSWSFLDTKDLGIVAKAEISRDKSFFKIKSGKIDRRQMVVENLIAQSEKSMLPEAPIFKARLALLSAKRATVFWKTADKYGAERTFLRGVKAVCNAKKHGACLSAALSLHQLHKVLDSSPKSDGNLALKEALKEPLQELKRLAKKSKNAWKKNHGYDTQKGLVVDFLNSGILDPHNLVKTIINGGASVVNVMLATAIMIVPSAQIPKTGFTCGADEFSCEEESEE